MAPPGADPGCFCEKNTELVVKGAIQCVKKNDCPTVATDGPRVVVTQYTGEDCQKKNLIGVSKAIAMDGKCNAFGCPVCQAIYHLKGTYTLLFGSIFSRLH